MFRFLHFAWFSFPASTGCAGGICQCNLGGVRIDGGVINDKDLLPVREINLGPASGTRNLIIGPVKCFGMYEILRCLL